MKIPIKHKRLGTNFMEIDDEDWDKIKDLNLTLNNRSNPNTYYCMSTVYEKCKYIKKINIHRLIMGLDDYKKDKRIINHIDGNGLNNKKENLEICDNLYNSQSINRHNGKFGLIYFEKNTEKTKRIKQYRFAITINKKRIQKRFLTENEAINYRDNLYKELTSNNKYLYIK